MFYDLLIFIFMSYIKPQPASSKHRIHPDCISYYSYIKPQQRAEEIRTKRVVYRTIPTSNHNWREHQDITSMLYIVLFLHQTTTHAFGLQASHGLYIVLFLHQTTTIALLVIPYRKLYIVLFLHQTTTVIKMNRVYLCCISYYSYIKPQLLRCTHYIGYCCISYYSYIKPQLYPPLKRLSKLYIVLFLHQTTTVLHCVNA